MKLEQLKEQITQEKISNAQELESFRVMFLGSKGLIKQQYALLKEVPTDQKKSFGKQINDLRQLAEQRLNEEKVKLSSSNNKTEDKIDNLILFLLLITLCCQEMFEELLMQLLNQLKICF